MKFNKITSLVTDNFENNNLLYVVAGLVVILLLLVGFLVYKFALYNFG